MHGAGYVGRAWSFRALSGGTALPTSPGLHQPRTLSFGVFVEVSLHGLHLIKSVAIGA